MFLIALTPHALASDFCEKTWPEDFSMQLTCLEQQAGASKKIEAWRVKYGVSVEEIDAADLQPGDEMPTSWIIFLTCAQRSDDNLVIFSECLQNQSKAAKSLGKL